MAGQEVQPRNIWMLSREYGSLAGAGGVKDVVSQLAEALARWTGRALHVVLPRYGFMDMQKLRFEAVQDPLSPDRQLRLQIDMNEPDRPIVETVGYFYKRINRVHIYLVDAKRFGDKQDVYTYTAEEQRRVSWQKKAMGHHDYFAMNLLHQKAALELMITLDQKPDVIHCHDGHTAVLPALIQETAGYRSYFRGTGCLVTVHNAGYGYHQEVADIPYARSITGLPDRLIELSILDSKFDPFMVAGSYALMNTVSENYARELQETENDRLTGWLGHELKKRKVELLGVTNGIEPDLFSPSILAAGNPEMLFDPGKEGDALLGKSRFKKSLLDLLAAGGRIEGIERFGTLQNNVSQPLFTFIGRLSEQKGIDVLMEVLEVLLEQHPHLQMLVLGSGAEIFEEKLITLTTRPQLMGRMCFLKGFSPELANKVYAAGDFFIIPSRYEPCGLTDFIAQLFGNIPVVHHVGGLVKVKNGQTGIAYLGDSAEDLFQALLQALAVYGDASARRRMQQQAIEEIRQHYTWSKVMRKYLELYKRARHTRLTN